MFWNEGLFVGQQVRHCGYRGGGHWDDTHGWVDNHQEPPGYYTSPGSVVGVIVKVDTIPPVDYDSDPKFIYHVIWDGVEGVYKYCNEDIHPAVGPCFINVYLRHRCYGGCEEGGWTYDSDEFKRCVFIADPVQAEDTYEKMVEEAKADNKDRRPIHSVLSDGIFVVRLEYAHGEEIAANQRVPHYC